MAARALGALLALTAAMLFAVSLASPIVWTEGPAWWDGHPTVDGKEIERKDVHIGLAAAAGCDSRGCQTLELGTTFATLEKIELGLAGLAVVLAALLGVAAMRASDRRKPVAVLSIAATTLAAIGAGALLLIGPEVMSTATVEVPVGLGMFVFLGGIVVSFVGSAAVLVARPEPFRLKPHLPAPPDAAHPPPVDVRDILRDHHALQPPPPEPRLGRPGELAPVASHTPRLRALYEVSGEIAPVPSPVALPVAPPTPVLRASASALAGPVAFEPPLAIEPPRAKAPSISPVVAPPPTLPAVVPPGTDPAVTRDRPSGPLPATPPGQRPSGATLPATPPGQRPSGATLPATPPGQRPSGATLPATPPGQRASATAAALPKTPPASKPKVPLPMPVSRVTPPAGERPIKSIVESSETPVRAFRTTQPTIAAAVPPPPTADNQPAPTTLSARTSAVRVDTDADPPRDVEASTAVEIDAEAKARAKAESEATEMSPVGADEPGSLGRDLEGQQALEGKDDDVGNASLGSAPIVELDTAEQRALAADSAARAESEPSSSADPPASEKTLSGPPVLPLPMRQPLAISVPAHVPPIAAPARVPISTAPTTLPPPKALATTATPSGPTPACPQCEAPMAWVEEHLRFYCKQCRMYF